MRRDNEMMNDPRRKANHAIQPTMLTVHDVARALSCSARTIYRLVDRGQMPRPVKLGALVRWPRETIDQWIVAGCPKGQKVVR